MNGANKAWLIWMAAFVAEFIAFGFVTMLAWTLTGFLFFYLRGKQVVTENIQKTLAISTMKIAPDSLKCDYCGKPPHLTETKEDKWACDSCYMKWWALHCPDCGIEVPSEWTGEQRQAHLDSHTTDTLNKDATVGTAA